MATRSRSISYWINFGVVLVFLAIAPLVLPEFWRRFVTEILIWGLLAMSLDILIGYTGMVSFGHAAFFGLGMYGAAAALLTVRPPNLWLAILYGLVGAGGLAVCVAYFSTRLRDIYFSITTLVFSQIFYVIIFTWTALTGGENGLNFRQPPFSIPGIVAIAFTPVTLTTPADGQLFTFGDTVSFQVTASDPEDGPVDCSRVGVVFGWIFGAHQLGAACAAWGAGAARTWLGDYQTAFVTAGLLSLIASGLVIRIARPRAKLPVPPRALPADVPAL